MKERRKLAVGARRHSFQKRCGIGYRLHFVAVAVALLLSFQGLRAADESGSLSSLQEMERRALLHNAGVKAAFERWRAAAARSPQARALPDPRVTYSYYIEQVETRVGPQEQSIGIAQTLPWFGKRNLRAGVADANAGAYRQRYEQAKFDVLYEVRSAYCDLYYLKQAIQITRDNMKLLETLERVAQSRYKTGGAMLPLVQLQTELGKLSDRVQELQSLRPARAARLNAALNRPPDAALDWPDHLSVPDEDLDAERLRAELAANSPILRAYGAAAKKHELQAELAEKRRRPDVTIGVKAIDTGAARNPDTPGSGKDPVMATLSINLPIWRSSYDAAAEEAERNRWAAVQQRGQRLNQLQTKLEMALFQYRDAGRKINLYSNTLIPKAEQSLKVAQQAFEAGEAEFLTLIDAERMLLEFNLQHEKARTQRTQQFAHIQKLVASPLPEGSSDRPQTNLPEIQGEQSQ